jgi:hypothetical protein
VLIIVGSLADFVALGFGDVCARRRAVRRLTPRGWRAGAQSIIAPLGSLTLVANVFFAPLILGERFEARDLGWDRGRERVFRAPH